MNNNDAASRGISDRNFGVSSPSWVERVYSLVLRSKFEDAEFALREVSNQVHRVPDRDDINRLRLFCIAHSFGNGDVFSVFQEIDLKDTIQKAEIMLYAGRYTDILSLFDGSDPDIREGMSFLRIAALALCGRVDEAQAWLDHSRKGSSPEGDVLKTILRLERGDIAGANEMAAGYNLALCQYYLGDSNALKEVLMTGDYPVDESCGVDVLKSVSGWGGMHEETVRDPVKEFNGHLEKLRDSELVEFLEQTMTKSWVPLMERNLGFYAAANLLILCVEFEAYSKAADILVSCNEKRVARCFVEEQDFDYLKLLTNVKSEVLREETILFLERSIDQQLLNAKKSRHVSAGMKRKLHGTCCVLGQAFWDSNNLEETERLLWRCSEYCSEFIEWKINYANIFLMKEKFSDALVLYEELIKVSSSPLNLPAAVLANYCVCLIMCDRNGEAEHTLEKVLIEEDDAATQVSFHSTVINLVIGHLYCSKKNYEFGMDRVLAALSDVGTKITCETWYYFTTTFTSMLAWMIGLDRDQGDEDDQTPLFLSDSFIEQIHAFLNKVCTTIDRKLKSNSGASILSEAVYMRDLFKRAIY